MHDLLDMKKYIPIIAIITGILVLSVVIVFLVKGRKTETPNEEETVAEMPFDQRPVVSLTPKEDGHWLTMKVDKIVFPSEVIEYEVLYYTSDGRAQGIPGSAQIDSLPNGNCSDSDCKVLVRELLLGSESSGKYRYDEGVEKGTITLRFRDAKGKLTGKLSTDFFMTDGVDEVKSPDSKLTFSFSEPLEDVYCVVMNTFGVYKLVPGTLNSGPYGIFTSLDENLGGGSEMLGEVSIDGAKTYVYKGNADWIEVLSGEFSLNSENNLFIGLDE